MKLLSCLSLLLFAAPQAASAAARQPLGMPGQWKLVFDDEFRKAGLDETKWTSGWMGCSHKGVSAPVNTAERDAYDPAQVQVSKGVLSLTLIRKPVTVCGKTYPFRTGLIHTDGKAEFTFGAFEARIYLPAVADGSVANWPAWWADGQNWPTDGEMDIMEGLDGKACFHFHSDSGAPGDCAAGAFTGWHTYGADWEPGVVKFYYDGVLVGTLSEGVTSAPMYLILDYPVGKWGGPVRAPATMKVDYVRVWRR